MSRYWTFLGQTRNSEPETLNSELKSLVMNKLKLK